MPRIVTDELRENALFYHRTPPAGKLAITATKPMANQRDLAWPTRPASRQPAWKSSTRPGRGRT
jgi:malate dehydrogenase (oxaloacetate-decarboxylating)(NADP+)